MPANRFAFTESAVLKIKPGGLKLDYWDSSRNSPPGFGVRVAPSGTRTWQLVLRIYYADTGTWRPTRLALGRVGEMALSAAREKARELKQQALGARDVRRLAQRREAETRARVEHATQEAAKLNTFAAARDAFLAHCERTRRPKTVKNYRTALAYCRAWENVPLSEITKVQVRAIFDGLLERGKNTMANRVHACLRAFFKWATENERFDGDAPLSKARPGGAEAPRERYLSDDEIIVFWSACERLDSIPGALMKTLLLLGQRSGETAGMRWSELKLDGRAPIWTIPPTRTKTGSKIPTAHVLPLPALVVDGLRSVPRLHGSDFVFWSRNRRGQPMSSDQANAVKLLRKHCADIVKAQKLNGVFTETWSAHTLRATLVSGLARLGVDVTLADRIIHHADTRQSVVARGYQRHTFEREARAALELWAAHVRGLQIFS